MMRRTIVLYAGLVLLFVVVELALGAAFTTRLCVEAMAYALIALGLNVQWGYGGLFNFGVMGFLMIGGMAVTSVSAPLNIKFWNSDGPVLLLEAIGAAAIGALIIIAAHRAGRIGIRGRWGTALKVIAWALAYILFRSRIDPAATYIESHAGWMGGLGLPVLLGWAIGGLVSAAIAYVIGKICLGLRTDYLAIATIGIAEIIRALVKNMDWLTRGTLTVSPIPWPVPTPQFYQDAAGVGATTSFVYARLGYFAVAAAVVLAVLVMIEIAYRGPWGRMMRAIRDNHIAAESMGKDVKARQIEIFVFGSVLMGIGGAMLTSFAQIFDPGGYQPINHTFIVWVMVIVGGAGNSLGVLFGGMFIYTVWVLSEPLSQALFRAMSHWSLQFGWGAIPDIESRSLQMRVFVLGLVITLALRYAPRGLIPEVMRRHGPSRRGGSLMKEPAPEAEAAAPPK